MNELREGLKKFFSFDTFLEGQDHVIEQVYKGDDICVVMPTGAGKSLCYQLPALVRPGYTVVISPLIALMKDQVDALKNKGIAAEYINSTQSQSMQNAILMQAQQGMIKLLYVAPERMRSQAFRDLLKDYPPESLVVDEAHCISQWGHDFRPDYTRLGESAEKLGIKQICAFTATATPRVREDIKKQLHRPAMDVVVTGFARPNLSLSIEDCSKKDQKLEKIRELMEDRKPTIIYCATRKAVEEVMDGLSVRGYHGGMSDKDRNDAQDYFLYDPNPVLAATNAFGMGIDRADIRQVIHYNFPGAIEAYYQEVGRAGRDGEQSTCVLLFSFADRYTHEFLIDLNNPDEAIIKSTWDTLRKMCRDTGENHFEMTLSELAESIPKAKGDQQLSGVMKELEKSNYIRRGFRQENTGKMGFAKSREELLADFPTAKTQRAIFIHRFLDRYGESLMNGAMIDISYYQMCAITGLKPEQVKRVVNALKGDQISWEPPFSGRSFEVLSQDELEIDFSGLRKRRESEIERLDEMISYVHTRDCRQDYLIKYFGADDSTWRCGTCDRCQPASGTGGEYRRLTEVETRQALRLMEAVDNFSGYLGLSKIAMLVTGSRDASIIGSRLKDSDHYGCLDMLDQSHVRELLQSLEGKGLVKRTKDKYPVLKVTTMGHEFIERPKALEIMVPGKKKRIKREPSRATAAIQRKKKVEGGDLYEEMRQLRNQLAKRDDVEPWLVLSNAALKALEDEKPADLEAFRKIKGIGDYRAARYGKDFLGLIAGK